MDDSMWQLTVKQANLYVTQFSVAHPNLKPWQRVQDWVDKDINKMKTFTGILLFQGILHKLENGLYFSKRESTETPYFQK
jgi:hypothetical protein